MIIVRKIVIRIKKNNEHNVNWDKNNIRNNNSSNNEEINTNM